MLLNACNLKCAYCRLPEIKTELLSTEQWKQILGGLAALGTMRIKFQGGEPTLRPDFADLCHEAKRVGMTTAVITNGSRLAERPALLDDVDEVVVSLDATKPEIHDAVRGAGSHAVTLRAVDHALARGKSTYAVMVVHRDNLDELEPMLGFCEARGVGLHAQPLLLGRDAFDDGARALQLTNDQVRGFNRRLAEWKRQGRRLMFSAATYENVARWPDYSVLTTRTVGDSGCMAGRFYVHIEPNGDVWPCSQHGASFQPRNIIKHGLVDALRSVQHHDCGDCFTAYVNERKAVFALKPTALLEVVRRG